MRKKLNVILFKQIRIKNKHFSRANILICKHCTRVETENIPRFVINFYKFMKLMDTILCLFHCEVSL